MKNILLIFYKAAIEIVLIVVTLISIVLKIEIYSKQFKTIIKWH
ncbi:hypothetical protein BH11BAC1_BH11BAC1_09720 [soil metagenome]